MVAGFWRTVEFGGWEVSKDSNQVHLSTGSLL